MLTSFGQMFQTVNEQEMDEELPKHRDTKNVASDSIFTIHQKTPLNTLFFSQKNIDRIQTMIKAQVYDASGKKIMLVSDQNIKHLMPCMTEIYYEHAKHHLTRIAEQVNELNELLLDKILPNILSEIRTRITFKNQLDEPRKIIDLPTNPSIKGNKTLPSALPIDR
jgi:hypothetical protein